MDKLRRWKKQWSFIRIALLAIQPLISQAQIADYNWNAIKANLKTHISVLASDQYEGREAGTEAEDKAAAYITEQFRSLGLLPKGDDGYLQHFPFTDHVEYAEGTTLKIDGRPYGLDDDFYPLIYSASATVQGELAYCGFGIAAPELKHDDYAGKSDLTNRIFVIEYSSPDGLHPHSRFRKYSDLVTKIETAEDKGAIAVIVINSDTTVDDPAFSQDQITRTAPSAIPVLFARGKAYLQFKDQLAKTVELTANLKADKRTGKNVIALLDNGAENTVIVGAHYDHLGYGLHGSLKTNTKHEVHNGADDNASGTATVVELARFLSAGNFKHNNYLFIAFSGEEKGLLGSNYFTKHPTIDLNMANYMLNLDMVGRLKEKKTLELFGTGTTPEWGIALSKIKVDGMEVKSKASGTGPSDYTPFYLEGIPVLSFFSGLHEDYHKPSDDEDKINYKGMVSIIKFILTLIADADDEGKLAYTKTKAPSASSGNVPKPRLSLGVIPDYMFEGEGMLIQGLSSEDKPAAKAGIKKGDILIKLGDTQVRDMRGYMMAMSNFKKGDKTVATVIREDKKLELHVKF